MTCGDQFDSRVKRVPDAVVEHASDGFEDDVPDVVRAGQPVRPDGGVGTTVTRDDGYERHVRGRRRVRSVERPCRHEPRSFGLGNEASLLAAAATLNAEARSNAPLFLPYLSGERSPHNDANAQGVLFGLTHAHGPAEVAYAVVEGVSFGLRDGLDTLARPSGDLVLVGGGARSPWWAQLLADILETPLAACEGGEAGGAMGAARLAWLADGGTEAEVCRRPEVRQRFEPNPGHAATYTARHARFKALYAGLRSTDERNSRRPTAKMPPLWRISSSLALNGTGEYVFP